jgi:uncharacterized membrane protein
MSRRITVDATTGNVKAEDLHLENESTLENMTKHALLGAAVGSLWSTRLIRNPIPGAIVGTAAGAIIGLLDGPSDLSTTRNELSIRPAGVFHKNAFLSWLE